MALQASFFWQVSATFAADARQKREFLGRQGLPKPRHARRVAWLSEKQGVRGPGTFRVSLAPPSLAGRGYMRGRDRPENGLLEGRDPSTHPFRRLFRVAERYLMRSASASACFWASAIASSTDLPALSTLAKLVITIWPSSWKL